MSAAFAFGIQAYPDQGSSTVPSLIVLAIAGQSLSGNTIACNRSGLAYPFDPTLYNSDPRLIIGMTTGGCASGSPVQVCPSGVVAGASGLVPGTPYFVGANGVPTSVVPTSGWLIPIGSAFSTTSYEIKIGPAVFLA